jgi:prepilin signal peptidase PulO-like enzyme (type II secretory pathway)
MIEFEYIDQNLLTFMTFVIGLLFGSFATMASYRIPRREDLIFKPSRCVNCQTKLGAIDLIPVFSWLLSTGKCRHCQVKISARYPLIELVTACLFCLSAYYTNFTIYSIALCFACLCLVIFTTYWLEKPKPA